MESIPLVSVVTPFYNTRDFLAECIESVLRQTYSNFEYILVDNCSTDGSSDIAKQYAARFPDKIRLLHTESFLSQVQNYNFALSCISPEQQILQDGAGGRLDLSGLPPQHGGGGRGASQSGYCSRLRTGG